MTWPQLKEMAERGHEISNHSFTHGKLVKMTPEEASREIAMNDSAIFHNTGIMPRTFCYPFNANPDWLVEIAEKGRVGTRMHQSGIGQVNNKMTPEKLHKWVDSVIETGAWGVGMTHGITVGYDKWNNPQDLWDMYDYVKARENDIWIARFDEAAAYRAVRDNTVVRKKHVKSNSFEITTKCSLDKKIFNIPVTVVLKGDWANERIEIKRGKQTVPYTIKGHHLLLNMYPNDKVKVKVTN